MATFTKMVQASVIAGAIGGAGLAAASGATISEGFEALDEGNINQTDFNSHSEVSLDLLRSGSLNIRAFGMESDRSAFVSGGAVLGAGELSATPAEAQFSMVGGIEIFNSSNIVRYDTVGGGLGFGYNNSTGNIGEYNGGAANVTVAVVKTSNGYFTAAGPNLDGGDPRPNVPVTFRLAHARNTSQNLGAFTQFGSDEVALEKGHWYQLVGTLNFLGFDDETGQSSFSTEVALYDLGAEGSESSDGPLTPILSGSTTFSYAGDWSTARPIFYAKDDRGFNQIDNLSYVPEPAALSLIAPAGLLALRRRRRA